MKKDLLNLIGQIENVKAQFHKQSNVGLPQLDIIYDSPGFADWIQELQLEMQSIYDRERDKFIWETLIIIKQGFNGWKDYESFNSLRGALLAIEKNIDKYYPNELAVNKIPMKEHMSASKKAKIFISHSSYDKDYANAVFELLEDIGLNEKQIFCSSIPGCGIPLDQDIYTYIKQQFQEYSMHVIFVLSDNYYQSSACLNEMGATWILQNRYTSILLPGFEFKDIEGAINPRKMSLKLDNRPMEVKEQLGKLKDSILEEFSLPSLTDVRWEQKRNLFLDKINACPKANSPSDGKASSYLSKNEVDALIDNKLSQQPKNYIGCSQPTGCKNGDS